MPLTLSSVHFVFTLLMFNSAVIRCCRDVPRNKHATVVVAYRENAL